MRSFKLIKLGEICDIKKGTYISKKTTKQGNIPVISGGEKPAYFHNEANRVGNVITISGSGNAGFVNYYEGAIWANDCVTILGKKDSADTKFILYYLKFKQKYIYNLQRGVTIKHVYAKDLEKIDIPLPPLETQKHIVSILERAEKLKEKRQITNEDTNKIIQSVFYEMFGDPVKNEKGWDLKKLDEVCEVIMGQSPSGDSYNYKKDGMIFFQGKAEFGEKYPSVKKWTSKPSKIALPNDTLISVRAPVGTANMSNQECCIGRGLAAIRSGKNINYEFLFRFIQLSEKRLESKGTGSTFKAISGKDVRDFEIIIPPIELQNQFAEMVQKIESLKEKQKQSSDDINILFDALMQKAFKGELVE